MHPTEEQSLKVAHNHLRDIFPTSSHHLHLAFCVPGILHPEKKIDLVDAQKALDTFRVNTLGPLLQIKWLSRFLPRHNATLFGDDGASVSAFSGGLNPKCAVFALMSARVGSITDNRAGGWYSYRASKAGVTQLAKTFDSGLQITAKDKAMCLALHPGTVRTDFTEGLREGYEKAGKVIDAEESAERLINVVNQMGLEGRGRFWDWKGEEVPP